MATLVLTAVGSAIGGPLGGAIGGLLGRQFDQQLLFRPKRREGPRLQELAVQTSSYGTLIPRVYGRMRVAGTVIWATDLQERRDSSGGGKGRPRTTNYSYSVSFMVALASRRISGIGRIWADGKIFRGAAGDFKTPVKFRFAGGEEDQQPDGFVASAEGTSGTPAYRGLAVAMFEDMELADYGNRIPSLTFELIADNGEISLAAILTDVSAGQIQSDISERLHGFAAAGENRRENLELLAEIYGLELVGLDQGIGATRRRGSGNQAVFEIGDQIVDRHQGRSIPQPSYQTEPESRIARSIALRYYEPRRDYQSGLQKAFRPGVSRVERQIEFPAAMDAEAAKNLAISRLWSEYRDRATASCAILPTHHLAMPGSRVRLAPEGRIWQVRGWEWRGGVINLSLTAAGENPVLAPGRPDPGRPVSEPDARAGPTHLLAVDLPFAVETPFRVSDEPRVYAAATGGRGWRRAALLVRSEAAGEFEPVGQVGPAAVIGSTIDALGDCRAGQIDRKNRVTVQLHRQDESLAGSDRNRLQHGANLAAIGREIVQFGKAEPLGDGQYVLSELLRGLGGGEIDTAGHVPGEDFLLLDGGGLVAVDPQYFSPFQQFTIAALGREDDEPVAVLLDDPGRALKPWSPVHPAVHFLPGGELELGWTRRSRGGLAWRDHVDVPLAEESEKYQVEIALNGESVLIREVTRPSLEIDAGTVRNWRDSGAEKLDVSVRQQGIFALSEPLLLQLSLTAGQ